MTDFRLTDGERAHPLWLRLRGHLAEQLALLRARNDDPAMDQQQTAALRGRIAAVRAIISLGDVPPPVGETRSA